VRRVSGPREGEEGADEEGADEDEADEDEAEETLVGEVEVEIEVMSGKGCAGQRGGEEGPDGVVIVSIPRCDGRCERMIMRIREKERLSRCWSLSRVSAKGVVRRGSLLRLIAAVLR
jgi:hypothetical protein